MKKENLVLKLRLNCKYIKILTVKIYLLYKQNLSLPFKSTDKEAKI